MKRIDQAEISGLLDGELSAERADEVRRLVAEDDSLRGEYEQLAELDAEIKAYAEAMMFQPRVWIPESSVGLPFRVPLMIFGLLLLRLVLKTLPPVLGIGLEIVVLVFVIAGLLTFLIRVSNQEFRLLARETVRLSR
jgi:hypothetical protein